MADTLEQIAERLVEDYAHCDGVHQSRHCDDCDHQRGAILSALQSLAQERDAAQAWAREQSMEERELRQRLQEAEQKLARLSVQEPRGQEGE
jgi:hypothetical protein